MPIRIIKRKIKGEDNFCPTFICDICKKPITEANHGIALYNWNDNGEPFFVHKFTCDRMSREETNKKYSCWMQLDDFLVYIGNNTSLPAKKQIEHAKRMIRI